MPTILIVNDDGVDSPMLRPMAEKLSALGTVRIAVPAEEQSWKGKAMTRFGVVRAEPRADFGVEAFAVSGTPSDCVNLAVHHLFSSKPDWIVSGINIGSNVGLGFILNSGTVGAAAEAMLQGIPSTAFSSYFKPEHFGQWSREKRLTAPEALEVVETTTTRMAAMMENILSVEHADPEVILNINYPGVVSAETPVRWVPMQNNRYGSIFKPEGDGFVHSAQVVLQAHSEAPTDRDVMLGGEISVTPLSLAGIDHGKTTGKIPEFPL